VRFPDFNKNSFAYRLISFVLLIMIAVYFLINLVIYQVVSELMVRNTREYLRTLVSEHVAHFDGGLQNIASQGRILRSILEDRLLSEEKLHAYLITVIHDNPGLISICVAPSPGIESELPAGIYLSAKPGVLEHVMIAPSSYQYRDWFQIAVLKNASHWGEPWYDELGSKQLVCSFSMPLHRNGRTIGVLRLDTAVRNLQIIELPPRLKTGAYAFIVSNTGTIITHPADSLVMNYSIFNLAEEYDDQTLMTIGKNMISGGSELVKVSGISYFQDQWIYYSQLPSNHWSVAIVVDSSFIFGDMKALLAINLAVSLLGFLVISTVIYLRTLKMHRPLKHIAETAARIGSGDFDAPLADPGGIYEVEQLTQAIEQMKTSLKQYIANLSEVTQEKDKIQSEFMFASEIQHSLVPLNTEDGHVFGGISCHGILNPAGAVGGDLYDYFMVDEHHFCFVIADVVGKGIVAAMTMTMVTTQLRTVSHYNKAPAEILYSLNAFLSGNELESNIITIMLGIIDIRDGSLWFSNCGHVPWYQRKLNHELIKHDQTHSTALGVFPDITIDDQILKLEPGDQIILMTDGVTEAINDAGEYFGSMGIESALSNIQNPSPDVTAITLLAAVETFAASEEGRDDLTILVVEFNHPV